MTDEELAALEIDKAEYEAGKAAITDAVKEYDPVVLYLEIEVYDEDDRLITEGPFDIKIKYTEDMAGYDSYKLVYVNLNDPDTGKSINVSNASFSLFALIGIFAIAGIAIVLKMFN